MVREDRAIRDRIEAISNAKQRAAIRVEEVTAVVADVQMDSEVVRGDLTIRFLRPVVTVTDKQGNVVGLEVYVKAFRDGQELAIDPHRVCINPPCLVPDGTFMELVDPTNGNRIQVENFKEDPRAALLNWLEESIRSNPGMPPKRAAHR